MEDKRLSHNLFIIMYSLFIMLYSMAALYDRLHTTHEGITEAPGGCIVAFSLVIIAMITYQAISLWKIGGVYHKESSIVLITLIIELILWFLYYYPFRISLIIGSAFYLNIPLWAFLVIGVTFSSHVERYHNFFLTVYLVKGFFMVTFTHGFLRAPWFIGEHSGILATTLLAVVCFFGPFYQAFTLGVLWYFREKREKKP